MTKENSHFKIKKGGGMNAGIIHLDAKIDECETLLRDIEQEGYETVSQVKGAIHSSLERLLKLKKERMSDE